MCTSFGMHHDRPATGIDKPLEKMVRLIDHQVGLERQIYLAATRLDDVGPHGHIGNKLTVHHVPMDAVGPGGFKVTTLLAESSKVGR